MWGDDPYVVKKSLRIEEKSVKGPDEDQITISVEASLNSLKRAPHISRESIGAVYVGSESKPYAVKPTAPVVAGAIGAPVSVRIADYEFACKGGTEAMISLIAQIRAGLITYGLAVGADCAQSRPGDVLEYTAGAGGSAFILGPKDDNSLAYIEAQYSVATDTPDFWRRDASPYPRHSGRFTGDPAYFFHITRAVEGLLKETGLKPEDFDFFVPHQPNGKFPIEVGRRLGFKDNQVVPSLVVTKIGNLYSGSSLTGFSKVLDIAKPGQRILLASFGSGSGSDAFSVVVQESIEERRPLCKDVDWYVNRKVYIDYATYSKFSRKIRRGVA